MPRFEIVIGHQPRFALATPRFRFRALAACAGRASLGGDREVAMACLVAGRLAAGMLAPYTITPSEAKARSVAAKQWLASLSVPSTIRGALVEVADAVASGSKTSAAATLTVLITVAARSLDEAAATELRTMIADLAAAAEHVSEA